MSDPMVSIVIVNFNGRAHLPDCLGSLERLDYAEDAREVLLVDNASTDGSAAWVRERFPTVRVLQLERNHGFAEAANRGAEAARGRIVVFLNTDTRVDTRWLSELVAPLGGTPGSRDPHEPDLAATAARMLDWTGTGLDFPVFATWLGMPYAAREDRTYRHPSDYLTPHYVLFPSGGAMAILRDVFLSAGGFDADYFMYHEDIDLGWRLWLRGLKVLYVPTATVYHRSGGSGAGDPSGLFFLNERNALFTVVKNAGDAWLARALPLMLLWLIERTGQYLGVDPVSYRPGAAGLPADSSAAPRGALAGLAAAMDLVRELPRLLEKRATVQAGRMRTDEQIAALFELPRDTFLQMMLRADIDFTRAAALVDAFALDTGQTSLFGRLTRHLAQAGGAADAGVTVHGVRDCLLYLADHTVAEAREVFGDAPLARAAETVGLTPGDLPVLARVLHMVGSKVLAGLVLPMEARVPTPPAAGASQAAPDDTGVLALAREALWRDAVFYREELEKRTAQVTRLLRARQGRGTADRVSAADAGDASEPGATGTARAASARSSLAGRVSEFVLDARFEIVGRLRAMLPLRTKRWIKRAILRQPSGMPPGWSWPAQTSAVVPAASLATQAPAPPAAPRRGYDVVLFPITDWHFRIQRSQQLAAQFAGHGHRVFYVSVTFGDLPETGDAATPYALTCIRPDIYEVRLPGPGRLSVYHDRLRPEVLERLLAAFEALRRDHNIVHAVSLVELPFWRSLASGLRGRFGWRLIYDCVDRHGDFSTNRAAMVAEEADLARESDLVVVTSQALYEEHRAHNPRCIRVANAADFAHFSVLIGEAPSWLQALRRPVIGYYGAIAEWFDAALVAEIARRRPQWSLVLVGSTYTADLRPLAGLTNVYLPGEQPYARLPAFLHVFDVCLIPFKRVPLTEAADPVKSYEYLSAGKPVVSVPLPELEMQAAAGLVTFADDAAGFVEGIERALAEDPSEAAGPRRQWVQHHTWDARYRQLTEAVRAIYPKASIVIPTHNNLHLTRLCLQSISRSTCWPHYEVIVVDNASTDGTAAFLQDLETQDRGVRVILNERNEGFARSINQGVAAAGGDYVVLLNNDTIVTRGWLTTLIDYLGRHPDVGIVGPASNQVGNEARVLVDYANLDEMEAFAARYTRDHAGHTQDLEMLAFFCAVMPRRVIDAVGMLDEQFGIGMFEDDDFCVRVRRAGYRLVSTDGAFVHHFHGATLRRIGDEQYVRLFEANKAKFEAKWGVRWTPHRYRWQR